jgi:hypothetical protein
LKSNRETYGNHCITCRNPTELQHLQCIIESLGSAAMYLLKFRGLFLIYISCFISFKMLISNRFKVCKSMHHHTVQINQLTRCNNFSSLLTFMYGSTCFRHPHTHHQELNCISNLWFYRWSVVVARPRPTAPLPPRSNGKTRGCYSSCWAPDDWHEDTRNMLSCT